MFLCLKYNIQWSVMCAKYCFFARMETLAPLLFYRFPAFQQWYSSIFIYYQNAISYISAMFRQTCPRFSRVDKISLTVNPDCRRDKNKLHRATYTSVWRMYKSVYLSHVCTCILAFRDWHRIVTSPRNPITR